MRSPAAPAPPTHPANGWLPDADLDPHPRGSWILQMGFDLWLRAFYSRAVMVADDFHLAPGTLIASNHQRDADGPMLGTILVCRRGLRFRWPLPFFATREDLFRPGILARLTVHWPWPMPALLGRIPLAWFFPLGHAEPMRRVREFTFGETLRALLDAGGGDQPCVDILNRRGLRLLHGRTHLCVRDAAMAADSDNLEHWWGLRCLTAPALRQIAPDFRATVDTQLAGFARHLDRGHGVYFAPEGTISMDGHPGRARSGFFRLAHMADMPPWIQPMALAYDTLAPGRSRVVVRIGEHFRADTSLDRRAFDTKLRRTLRRLTPVTPSHLLAHYLLHGPAAFTQAELAQWIAACATTLRTRCTLDPLLSGRRPQILADQRLRWLEGKRLVLRRGERFRNACPRDVAPSWRHPANIVRYLDNQFIDLVPPSERVPPC